MMRFLKVFFKVLLTFLLACITFPYIFSPAYDFNESFPFSGEGFYNPYPDICKLNFYKGNFHSHSNSWGFITNGGSSNNSPGIILKEYKRYGYDVVGISDYMSICPESNIPVYEHGMGFRKNHQLVIGAKEVLWTDFIPYQGTSNKQYILNHLKKETNLVVLSHPSWNNAYTCEDIKLLGNYDCIEVLSTNKESLALWDTALSAGKPVFLLVNDDGHDALNPEVTGRIFNVFAAKDLSAASIIEALKAGRNIGYEIPFCTDTVTLKRFHDEIIVPDTINIINDTLMISFKDTMKVIRLLGQGGIVRTEAGNSVSLFYSVKKKDTYLRCEAEMYNGTRIFLNPVVRGTYTINKINTDIDYISTILLSGLLSLSFLFITYLLWRPGRK